MNDYRHILAAVDLSPESEQVIARAHDMAQHFQARLSFVHVVEPVVADPGYDMMPVIPVEIQDSLIQRAQQYLGKLAGQLAPAEIDQHVAVGSVKGEIFRLIEEQSVDLVVLGTHGRHGVGLLLGSTANALLHGTPCDVLAVRIED